MNMELLKRITVEDKSVVAIEYAACQTDHVILQSA
jgi:hypothetical protein